MREYRIGVWEEMRESEARLMGEIGNIMKDIEGLRIGLNELKKKLRRAQG